MTGLQEKIAKLKVCGVCIWSDVVVRNYLVTFASPDLVDDAYIMPGSVCICTWATSIILLRINYVSIILLCISLNFPMK